MYDGDRRILIDIYVLAWEDVPATVRGRKKAGFFFNNMYVIGFPLRRKRSGGREREREQGREGSIKDVCIYRINMFAEAWRQV